jgi:hypothetical protein
VEEPTEVAAEEASLEGGDTEDGLAAIGLGEEGGAGEDAGSAAAKDAGGAGEDAGDGAEDAKQDD